MREASEYLSQIKALIVLTPQVVHWEIVREEAQGDAGLFRYRLNLRDGSLLEMFELFQVVNGKVNVRKYSFHWQGANSHLIKRWDNAAHHPEVLTYPPHLHDGTESNVLAQRPIDAKMVLAIVVGAVG